MPALQFPNTWLVTEDRVLKANSIAACFTFVVEANNGTHLSPDGPTGTDLKQHDRLSDRDRF